MAKLIVLIGPSGVGKGSIEEILFKIQISKSNFQYQQQQETKDLMK